MTVAYKRQREIILDDLRVGFGENSWNINLPLSSCRNLFEKEELDFRVQAFVCKCGETDICVTSQRDKAPSYVCPQCDNNQFYTMERISNKYGDLLVNIENDAELLIDQGYAYAKVYLDIPNTIDLPANKVIFDKKLVYELRIKLESGDEKHTDIYKVSPDVMQVTHMALLKYIDEHYLTHKLKNHALLQERMVTSSQVLKTVKFFLKYPLLEDATFLFWNMDKELYLDIKEQKNVENALAHIRNGREEKSIKKSLYRRYMHEIEYGKFDTLTPYIICQVFTDPNHICKLLDNHNLDFTYNDSLNIQNAALLHIGLIGFLKEYFNEKTLANMFKRAHNDISLWEDSISMYSTLVETTYLLEHFQKPRANVVAIHNAFIRAGHYAEYSSEELDFSYTKDTKKCCVLWHNRLEIRLPQTSFDLMDWSKILDNCLYGYILSVLHQTTTIFGVFIDNQLAYAIEIQNNKIVQMYGKHNKDIEGTDRQSLLSWHQKYFIQ